MTIHITARLTWHDSGWNGCICENPASNTSCTVHEYIRDSRDDEFEKNNAGKPLSELNDYIPPCASTISLFSPFQSHLKIRDPLKWRGLKDVQEDLDPFSFCATPMGRMRSQEKGVTWENNPKKQLNQLNEFFNNIEERWSLAFFYTDHGNPLLDESGDRLLIGVARIVKKGTPLFFPEISKNLDDNPIWFRTMTINPDQSVMIPYQEYLKKGYDSSNITCKVPDTLRTQFSYVSEQLTDDEAVVALETIIQAARAVQEEGKAAGDWSSKIRWLDEVLAETWMKRGAYPGIGSVLKYLEMPRGTTYQLKVLQEISKQGEDTLEHLQSILAKEKKPEKMYEEELNQVSDIWSSLPESRRTLLSTLCRFEFSKQQVDRIVNSDLREKAGITANTEEILENPYILCEQDQTGNNSSAISFEQIDHGMIPLQEIAETWGRQTTVSQNDKRRIRAILVDILKSASKQGDTLLSINDAFEKVRKRLPGERVCNPDSELIMEQAEFYRKAIAFDPEAENPLFALPSLKQMENEISEHITDLMIDDLKPSDVNWQSLLEKEIGAVGKTQISSEVEARAQQEKTEALEKLFRFKFSLLTGHAGTGKTTVVKILLKGLLEKEGRTGVLLLAPTGKARIRLKQLTGQEAFTIHQYLYKQGWIDKETFRFKESGGKPTTASTIIVDEASMIPLDLFAILFKSIIFHDVKRLILIGDSNQLPPIGPGRVFVDIIDWLDANEERKKHLIYLKERVRQRKESQTSEALRLSDGFIVNFPSPNDDEILSEVSHEYNKGDLEVHFWNNSEELYNILNNRMAELLSLDKSENAYSTFNASLGIGSHSENNTENWQILSPVRILEFGTREINRLIQQKYRGRLIENSRRSSGDPRPFGDERLVYVDKVIQVVNTQRRAQKNNALIYGYVANGEVGYISRTHKEKIRTNDSVDVVFSTQPDLTYRYHRHEVDYNLELAYAITVHKAQGSDFRIVFLIIPPKARTLSKELLYTGLTRFKDKLVLLVEKDITPLRMFRRTQESETLSRNTNLFTPIVRPEGIKVLYSENLRNRTLTGEMVRSKSEVVVANVLTKLGLDYKYEEPLQISTHDFRLPDFTICFRGNIWYWEHLGMLNLEQYKKDWEQKKSWYQKHNLMDRVITSQDGADGSINSQEIERIARERILMS